MKAHKMAIFSPLRIEKVEGASGGRQLWVLLESLTMRFSVNGGGVEIAVPANCVTDFASVPRLLWPIVPPTGPWCEAAVVHDYLCAQKACSRFLADSIFREAMYRLGVPAWRRVSMYYAVRCYSVYLSLIGGDHDDQR